MILILFDDDIDPANSAKLDLTTSIDGNSALNVTLAHKGAAHDAAAVKFTVQLAQAGDSMFGSTKTIVDSFDVFMHTLNDGFLRLDTDLDGETYPGTTLPNANALTWSLWDGSDRYNDASTTNGTKQFAKFEFEAGSGDDYVQKLGDECLHVSKIVKQESIDQDITRAWSFPGGKALVAGQGIVYKKHFENTDIAVAANGTATITNMGGHQLAVGDKVDIQEAALANNAGPANADANVAQVEVLSVGGGSFTFAYAAIPAQQATIAKCTVIRTERGTMARSESSTVVTLANCTYSANGSAITVPKANNLDTAAKVATFEAIQTYSRVMSSSTKLEGTAQGGDPQNYLSQPALSVEVHRDASNNVTGGTLHLLKDIRKMGGPGMGASPGGGDTLTIESPVLELMWNIPNRYFSDVPGDEYIIEQADVEKIVVETNGGVKTHTVHTVENHGLENGDFMFILGASGASSAFVKKAHLVINKTGDKTFTFVPGGTIADGNNYANDGKVKVGVKVRDAISPKKWKYADFSMVDPNNLTRRIRNADAGATLTSVDRDTATGLRRLAANASNLRLNIGGTLHRVENQSNTNRKSQPIRMRLRIILTLKSFRL